MRILLVNWARIWDGAAKGGGVNGYCQSLALELTERGHDVAYLFAGVTVTREGAPLEVPGEFRRHADWLGIKVFELVDSPVLAPAAFQFRDPLGEASNPRLANHLREFVERLDPDVVHFHNIEGLSADCISAARGRTGPSGRPRAVVYSLHNYHTLCPQAYLLHRYVTPCLDFDGGRACESCIDAVDPASERARRARDHAAEAGPPGAPAGEAAPAPAPIAGYGERLAEVMRRVRVARAGPSLPGEACDSESAFRGARPPHGADTRGQTLHVLADRVPAKAPGPDDPAWAPIRNLVPAEARVDPSDPSANRYGVRRSRMVDGLNACDRVLAVSGYVRERFQAAGVRPDLLRVQPIGTRVNRTVDRLRTLVFDPPPFDPGRPRPIRMVFMGYNSVYKGLPMLADTLEMMTPECLARFHLFLFAQGGESIEWRFRRLEPRLGGLSVYYGYQPHDIPWMLGGKDLGVVPSVWWDNAPQTVFEFFACGVPVLGANVGGIPDFVKEGRNGMLFTANDRFDLGRRLWEVARDPSGLTRLRAGVRPPLDMRDHAAELEKTYGECLSSLAAGRHGSPDADAPKAWSGHAGLPAGEPGGNRRVD